MPQPSKISRLPPELVQELEAFIVRNGFGAYAAAAAWLRERAEKMGVPEQALPRRAAITDYGAQLQKKLARIKASTAAAAMIAREAPDDADQRSAAVMSMLQTQLFDVLVTAQELDEETDPSKRMKLLSALAANVAKLSRASVNQKKHEIELRGKVEAAVASVEKIAKKGGLSKGAVAEIRREILGIPA